MSVNTTLFYTLQVCTLPLKNFRLVDMDLTSSDKCMVIHPYCVPVTQQIQQMMSSQQIFLEIHKYMDYLLDLL